MRRLLCVCVLLLLLFGGPLYLLASGRVTLGANWRTASRVSAGLAAIPSIGPKAAILLLSARTFNWRGMFSVHTWLALKQNNTMRYTIYQCIGWNRYLGIPIVDIRKDIPDRMWFGAKPKIEAMLVGKRAEQLIPRVKQAVTAYPFKNRYRAWPGPNSNTFIAFVLNQVPELGFTMPYNALGYDYGWKFSLHALQLGGFFGYSINNNAREKHKKMAWVLNLLGLPIGMSFAPLGLILPGVGFLQV